MKIRVLNLGAGVQSTTIALMAQINAEAVSRGDPLPYPAVGLIDFAVFGDTGDEPWKVYMHLCWLVGRCSSIRFLVRSRDKKRNRILTRLFPFRGPVNIDRARRYLAWLRRIELGTLRGSLKRGVNSTGQRFASIPAFTWDGKTVRMTRRNGHVPDESKVRRQCTSEWKIAVVERSIRREVLGLESGERIAGSAHVVQIFGLSFDEPSRVIKVRARFMGVAWASCECPLFEMEQTRGGCKSWLRNRVPHNTPRSACTHCPLHDNDTWREMRDDDNQFEWREAIGIDEALRLPGAIINRGLDAQLYLHRSCKPLSIAPIDEPETNKLQSMFGFMQECEGMCGT